MAVEFDKAVRYAYKLLGYRQRSIKELGDRLKRKGFSSSCIRDTLEPLKSLGYLDDHALARSLRYKASETKLLGTTGAKQYLVRMGIPRNEAEDVLFDYDELSSAKRLLEKKMGNLENNPKPVMRRRLVGYLRRRGYSTDTIRKSLRTMMEEEGV